MALQELSQKLDRLIRPQSFPIGIKILPESQALPEKATRPARYNIQISLCQWTTVARRWGRVVGVLAEDVNCSPCLAGLGLKKMQDRSVLSDYFLEMGYFDTKELAERAMEALDPLPPGALAGVAMFPLDQAQMDPDLIVIYGTPAQMARLAAGYVYHTGELIASNTTGFGLSCLSLVKPFWTGKAAFVHPGRGERILAGTDETEMLFTFPAANLAALVDGLEKTHKKGSRYPIQSYMLYEPPQIPSVKALADKLT